MSHVDDGMLHAYLDGALSALDAVRVERHVADCAACQQRLDAARVVIQRAARLLEWAGPPAERAAPPLAELRPYSAPRWQVPVAWAATIVIALGVGVYGGQILLRDRPAQLTETKEELARSRDAESERRAAPITVIADSPSVIAAAAPAESDRAAPAPAAPAPVAQAPAAGITTVAVPARDSVAANKLADATAKARVDTAAALAMGARRQEAPPAAPAAAAAPSPLREADSLRVSGLTSTPTAEKRAANVAAPAVTGAGAATTITADSARVLLGTPAVALPDYPVTAIRVRDGAVVVEHVLPPGRVIRLVQRRAGAVVDERLSVTGSDALARYVDGLRVEISGSMAADSLSVLLGRARAMP